MLKQTAQTLACGEPQVQTRLNHDHFSAWIKAGDEELPLYEQRVELRQGKVFVSAYIPSEAGTAFSVHWRDTRRSYSTCTTVFIDNVEVGYNFINSTRQALPGPDTQSISSMRTSEEFTQELMFTMIETTEDDAYLDKPFNPFIGKIEVAISKGTPTWVRKRKRSKFSFGEQKRPKYSAPNLIDEVVHERSLKSKGHRFQLGTKTYNPVEDYSSEAEDDYLDTFIQRWKVDDPHVTFIFNYRSKARLQADRIIPKDKEQEATNSQKKTRSPEQNPSSLASRDKDEQAASCTNTTTGSSSRPRPHTSSQAPALTVLECIDLTESEVEDSFNTVVGGDSTVVATNPHPAPYTFGEDSVARTTQPQPKVHHPKSFTDVDRVKNELKIKQERIDGLDPIYERVRRLKAELAAATKELNRRERPQDEVKEEDPVNSLAANGGASENEQSGSLVSWIKTKLEPVIPSFLH